MADAVEERDWRLVDSEAGDADKGRHRRIKRALRDGRTVPYHASKEIFEAVNTAVSLGKPLLVSGEPGVGKTMLAEYVARRFGLFADGQDGDSSDNPPEVLRFVVKSTTKGADLIYRYDAIRHFRDVQLLKTISVVGKTEAEPVQVNYESYIELEALGAAIAIANGLRTYASEQLTRIANKARAERAATDAPRISVVLIDEIDKAPRDVPNDLLDEIDRMEARIPELGASAVLTRPDFDLRPIIIITTNDERALPEAFLRRCCFLHIPFPEPNQDDGLRKIIQTRLGLTWAVDNLAGQAITLVHELRAGPKKLSKRPATAELLDFIRELLARGITPETNIRAANNPKIQEHVRDIAKAVFAKTSGDKLKIDELLRDLPGS